MSKIENNIFRASRSECNNLDTLEITSDFSKSKTLESQYRTAMRKHATNEKLIRIIDAVKDVERKKTYWKTYHCNNVLLQDGRVFKGSLCRKRWCSHCSRIKTAEMTNGYKEPLQALGQLYFVTLTRPNVKARELKSEVSKLIKAFQRIKDNLRKNHGIKLNGIRKIEVTYNETENTYHPHFHFIQSDKIASEMLLNLWLSQFPNAKSIAQDIRPISATDENSFIELFKYATKETTKSGEQYTGEVLDNIYRALEGRRIYQTYGELKKVKEPTEAKHESNQILWIEPNQEIWVWEQNLSDWTNANGDELVMTHAITHQQKTLNLTYESTKTETITNRHSTNQREKRRYPK